MQLAPFMTAPARSGARVRIVIGLAVGAVLVVGGLALGWLMLGTSFLASFVPTGRPEPAQMALGAVAWGVALIAPAAVLIVGAARLASVAETILAARPRPTPAARLASVMGDDYVVATRVALADGRRVPEIVIGPFGAAVIAELPPSGLTRHRGITWEVRGPRGQWLPLENPLDRAARDAERVRRWIAQEDHDFVVKTYAAVVSRDSTVERTATCAVIEADQIPAWLRSLPAQRSLTPTRRARIVELIREAS
jgi:hypothetical protein